VAAMTWEFYKPTWFIFGMFAAQMAVLQPAAQRQPVRRSYRPQQPVQPERLPTRLKDFWNANFSQFQSAQKRKMGNNWGPR
jgi:hypothetical protein